jgi:hypothetical protein
MTAHRHRQEEIAMSSADNPCRKGIVDWNQGPSSPWSGSGYDDKCPAVAPWMACSWRSPIALIFRSGVVERWNRHATGR